MMPVLAIVELPYRHLGLALSCLHLCGFHNFTQDHAAMELDGEALEVRMPAQFVLGRRTNGVLRLINPSGRQGGSSKGLHSKRAVAFAATRPVYCRAQRSTFRKIHCHRCGRCGCRICALALNSASLPSATFPFKRPASFVVGV